MRLTVHDWIATHGLYIITRALGVAASYTHLRCAAIPISGRGRALRRQASERRVSAIRKIDARFLS